jgi:phasin family protein
MPAPRNGNTNEAVNKVADAARNVAHKATSTAHTVTDAARNVAHKATHTVTDAARNVADKATSTAHTVTDEVGRIGEQTVRAGADVLHRGTETARDTVQAGLNTAAQIFQGNTNEAANKATGAGRDAADEAARTARTVTDEAGRIGEQTTRAGADIARRGTETARDTMQSGLNAARETFQRVTDQFTQVLGFNGPQAEELARRSSQNLQAVSQANTVLARGFQEASNEVLRLAQDRLQKNVEAVSRIAGTRSVQDFVAVQSDLMREGLQQVIDTNKRVAELSVRVADEAAHAIQAQAGQARRAA